MFMGNRGVIHNQGRELKNKNWCGKRWICCSLSFNGIDRRPLFKTNPFSYSELFFLDEATAYSSGHRPCNDCRKADLAIFKKMWAESVKPEKNATSVSVAAIDEKLHGERLDSNGNKSTYRATLTSLPPGVMVAHSGKAYLVRKNGVCLWSVSGYSTASLPPEMEVDVLTPKSIVQMIGDGLPVQVHESAYA